MTENKPPIFIMGAQRSGTTMLRLMMDAHDQIAIPFETDFIVPYYLRLEEFGDLRQEDSLRDLLTEIFANRFVRRGELSCLSVHDVRKQIREPTYAAVVEAVFRTWAESRGKSRWGDKNPGVPDIHILNALFPEAMFLHIIRDGRDVAASRKATWQQNSINQMAHHWCWNVAFVRKVGFTLIRRYKEIRYESLVLDPENTLRNVCDWLGERYECGMLEYWRAAEDKLPAYSVRRHHRTSVLPPDPSKIGVWRSILSRGERAIFQTVSGSLLRDLGYELESQNTLRMRLAKRLSEIKHSLLGRTVFPSPCLELWSGGRNGLQQNGNHIDGG